MSHEPRRRLAVGAIASTLLLGLSAPLVSALSDGPYRTDHRIDGNRVAEGIGPIESAVDVELAIEPAWVLPAPGEAGRAWIVVGRDGRSVHVNGDGSVRTLDGPAVSGAPVAALDAGGDIVVRDGHGPAVGFDDALPDARVVTASDGSEIVLTGATERYPHGVLGDAVEAGSMTIRRPDSTELVIAIEGEAVIEGQAPIAADLDGDGSDEIIVTVSDSASGARLRAYGLDGMQVGESDPIGQGSRWRHQIAVGPVGPEGEIELLSVRTPHIGGIVEAFQLVDDKLELTASVRGFSSHRIGSPNLDMALLADVDGDGRLELVVPTDDMTRIAALRRTVDGFELVAQLPLDGRLASNIAATPDRNGRLVLAAATEDGRLRIFR